MHPAKVLQKNEIVENLEKLFPKNEQIINLRCPHKLSLMTSIGKRREPPIEEVLGNQTLRVFRRNLRRGQNMVRTQFQA